MFDDGVNASDTEICGAFVALCCMLVAMLTVAVAAWYAQPWRIQRRACLESYYPRVWFAMSALLLLTAIVVFVAADSVCFANTELQDQFAPPLEFELGASIVLDIVALLLLLPCCAIAM